MQVPQQKLYAVFSADNIRVLGPSVQFLVLKSTGGLFSTNTWKDLSVYNTFFTEK